LPIVNQNYTIQKQTENIVDRRIAGGYIGVKRLRARVKSGIRTRQHCGFFTSIEFLFNGRAGR
jgi:predicted Rdx family selenoprotein